MTSRAWSGLLRRLAPRVEAGSRGHPDAAAVPHGLCREAPAPYRGPAYALGVLCPLKPPCPPRGRQQAAGGMAEVGGDGGTRGPCWCCGPCGSQERDRTPRVRPLSMVLGRASGHTRAGLLGTPAARGALSPSCRGASAVGVGGSLFTSGDGLVFPGELRPRQPSCCQEAGPGARELLGKSRSLEGQGRSSSRCFG